MSYAGVERGPGWVEWAEQETVARLRDQLSALRLQRELRRASEADAEAETAEAAANEPTHTDPLEIEVLAIDAQQSLSPLPAVTVDHPQRTHVSAFSEPPDRHGADWHGWAEAQTVLRLRQSSRARHKRRSAPPSPPELRLEVSPGRTIRIHHENLKAVGVLSEESA